MVIIRLRETALFTCIGGLMKVFFTVINDPQMFKRCIYIICLHCLTHSAARRHIKKAINNNEHTVTRQIETLLKAM